MATLASGATPQKLRVLVVDDEPLAREKIRHLLRTEPDIGEVEECQSGAEAVVAIRRSPPDLVFLDIQMPEMDGFEVLSAIGTKHMPVFIFVTAHDQFALRAFDVHALDYLLKPFDRERFGKALCRARAQVHMQGGPDLGQRFQTLLDHLRPGVRYLERLVVKSGGRVFFLRVQEVDWIESAGNYVRLNVGKESHLLRETMASLEARLDPRTFVRIHRTLMVNVERIKEMQPWFHGDYVVILRDGTQLTSSRGYRQRLQELLRMSA